MKTLLVAILAITTAASRADLFSYVAKPTPETKWEVTKTQDLGACEVTSVRLVSQVWEGITWEHDLVLFRPKEGDIHDKVYLLNNGGQMKQSGMLHGVMLATTMKAPVAFLLGIPNQPLLGGKNEDDLIAETFVRYLETENANWPLLFPMVKSLIKAMDAVQAISAKSWPKRVEKFVVGGASKRGWTTWLTAVADSRVMAITPMVIDVLNMPAQLARQVECFGKPSEQIRPYVARDLVPIKDTPEAQKLWKWVDPWTYREKLTLPKLVVLGNNDRYWAPDALNIYWDGLPGPKWISYTPNAGHNLTARTAGGGKDPMRAVYAAAAFTRHQMTGKPMPDLAWKHGEDGANFTLKVTSDLVPKSVRVWRCEGPTKDLREATWTSRDVEMKDGTVEITETRPGSGVASFYADCTYEIDGVPYSLCTQLRMIEAK